MGDTPQSRRKAPAAPRAREKAPGADRSNSAASPQTYSSIPRMPKILSPSEISSRYSSADEGDPPPGDQASDSGKRRTLMDGATGRRAAVGASGTSTSRQSSPPARRREQNAARPLSQVPGTLKLPAIPEGVYTASRSTSSVDDAPVGGDPYDDDVEDWDEEWDGVEAVDDWEQYARQSGGRELIPVNEYAPLDPGYPIVSLSTDSIPDLAAFRPQLPSVKARRRVNTQMLIERARSPWSIARATLAILAMIVALFATIGGMGEPSQKLMETAFAASAGGGAAFTVTQRVQPETQLLCPSCYDNNAQFVAWGDADCSAASASEVLTAWGVRGASIGKMIDAMVPDISLNGGLLTINGYQRGASHFGYRADISSHLSYNQILYISHTLGLPVIVNVRISYGYFHFFSGGHFLVVTNGDSQGVTIVDSSEYYIKYLPRDVLYSMFTGITVVLVPNGFNYSVPNI